MAPLLALIFTNFRRLSDHDCKLTFHYFKLNGERDPRFVYGRSTESEFWPSWRAYGHGGDRRGLVEGPLSP